MVKAVVMEGPGKLSVKEFPYPKVERGSALIKVEMAGICGTDKHMFKGETVHPRGLLTKFPIIPGHEVVGRIAEVSDEASKSMELLGRELKVGDRVVLDCAITCGKCYSCRKYPGFPFCDKYSGHYGWGLTCKDPPHLFGGWSEYLYALPDTRLLKVPPEVPPEVAVLTEPMTVPIMSFTMASNAVSTSYLYPPPEYVVIQGSGPIGMLHLIFSKLIGTGEVIMIGRPEYRLKIAEAFGASYVINIDEIKKPEERVREVLHLTGGRGADLVIEATGNASALPEGLEMLGRLGTYVITGIYIDVGEVSINPQRLILSKWAHIVGVPGQTHQSYPKALELLRKYEGKVGFSRLITHRFKLEEAVKAMEVALSEECMKVVFTP
ncbi:MAG: hypothetical protein B6U69_00975 [Thermofilum sp. ex4484_15]|nr:MAG: hypothetical protein B6U69_00975 [Thermofilum sp. ex4484_15]